ncbi:ELL2 factor, partial [Machaerirhynchus nigripectus]|nr:ELL2 factor [Machaerirhynchus nigripectus]
CSNFSIREYVAMVSLEQCQHYKDDFTTEYEEYRNLHVLIDKITRSFRKFDEQWKFLSAGSKAYQVEKDKTVKITFHLSYPF